MRKFFTNRVGLWALLLASLGLLTACSVTEIQKVDPFNSHDTWVMLPFTNHSDTPEAAERAADITETLFRSQRKVHVVKYYLKSINKKSSMQQSNGDNSKVTIMV